MWKFIYLFILVTVCNGKSNDILGPPQQFSDTYSVKGTLNIPYAEIQEPFYAWFDLQKGKSRIDYYGGMVKTFQLANEGEFKIAPRTTQTELNVPTCFKAQVDIKPQSVFPDISNFKYVGEDMVGGVPCSKWSLTTTFEDKVNKYTMWTESRNFGDSGKNLAVPVRYEMKGFNTLMGSHYDHYYLDYESYSTETPDDEIFQISNYSCYSFPGSPENYVYTFNPMREFAHNDDQHVHSAFEDFKITHGKNYTSEKEHVERLNIFRQNLRFIHSHNRAGKTFQLGVNHLADKNDLELRALRGYRRTVKKFDDALKFPYNQNKINKLLKDLPESLDWRLNGAVTPVKDQSVCGSCWSFGTTGAIEGAYFLKHGKLLRASQQALVDCSWGFDNNGCDGGNDYSAYQWIMKSGGIPTEDDYGPYLGQDGYCHVNNSMERVNIKGYVSVPPNNENALKIATAVHGPISVAIDAAHKTFSFYSNGVFYDPSCSSNELDHAVLLVGYGKLNGEDYWLIKNSWSTYWGNDGYILMSIKDNNCGVQTSPTYVTM